MHMDEVSTTVKVSDKKLSDDTLVFACFCLPEGILDYDVVCIFPVLMPCLFDTK